MKFGLGLKFESKKSEMTLLKVRFADGVQLSDHLFLPTMQQGT